MKNLAFRWKQWHDQNCLDELSSEVIGCLKLAILPRQRYQSPLHIIVFFKIEFLKKKKPPIGSKILNEKNERGVNLEKDQKLLIM